MILYGSLEDERPFNSVRRLVEYEDYMLRYMRDAGVPTAAPIGFVEITPEREYLILTEFLAGAAEISDVPVTDELIEDAIGLVRSLWSAGVAHRDIKPANVLVRNDRAMLIDAAFCQARPSPWRQAVDLANMMLVLALRTEPARVYQAATRSFTPEEIAEAFAATRGVTVPAQLRSELERDGRDLIREFRELAPERPAIPIQRWSIRRIVVSVSVLLTAALGILLIVSNILRAGLL
jgi:tRNA A-37 threonylcarbamoyl transferase component Bud32